MSSLSSRIAEAVKDAKNRGITTPDTARLGGLFFVQKYFLKHA